MHECLRIPADALGNQTALKILDLSQNELTGPVPGTLCALGDASPLMDLRISMNNLRGMLDLSGCVNLFTIDATVSPPLTVAAQFMIGALILSLCKHTRRDVVRTRPRARYCFQYFLSIN